MLPLMESPPITTLPISGRLIDPSLFIGKVLFRFFDQQTEYLRYRLRPRYPKIGFRLIDWHE